MITVTANTLGECWLGCIEQVLHYGNTHYDEDVMILEILGLCVEITAPSSKDDLIAKAGDKNVIDRMLRKFAKGVVMSDRPFTYGGLIYDFNGIDQFAWMIDRLKNKPESKSATVSLLIPGLNEPHLPCLNVLDAKIRGGKLELQFFFRSQNIFGRQYANLLALADLHENLAHQVGCEIGSMKGYIASAHIYEYDIPDAKALNATHLCRISDNYYSKGPSSDRS